MKFQFKVNLSEQDYLDYNLFLYLRSHYGKNQMRTIRILIAIVCVLVITFFLLFGGLSGMSSVLFFVLSIAVMIFSQLFLDKSFAYGLKWQIKDLKKRGKMAYSPKSLMEFYEDVFVETTPENKNEQKYSSIERISLVDNKVFYIHISNLMAYMLPVSCFESKEQFEAFLSFIKTKCEIVDTY